MVNHYGFAALKQKRAEITGRIKTLRKEIAKLEDDLSHLDATMRLFDPSYPVESVKPRRAQRLHLFTHGQLTQLVLDALRQANGTPLSTAEIGSYVVKAIGQDESARPAIHDRVRASLAHLEKVRGLVMKIGSRQAARWELAR